jgi:hypothetical protein
MSAFESAAEGFQTDLQCAAELIENMKGYLKPNRTQLLEECQKRAVSAASARLSKPELAELLAHQDWKVKHQPTPPEVKLAPMPEDHKPESSEHKRPQAPVSVCVCVFGVTRPQ